jgi:hypothetical protein
LATAKKILKLDTFAIEDDFFQNAALIGISCEKPIFTLCHILNQAFQLSFARIPSLDITIGKKNHEQFSFAVYQSLAQNFAYCYTLYKLKIDEIQLLPGLKNIDYIWLVASDDSEFTAMQYLKKLRGIPEIQFVSLMEKDKIKNIEYLIL